MSSLLSVPLTVAVLLLFATTPAAQTVTTQDYEHLVVRLDLATPVGNELINVAGGCTVATTWGGLAPGAASDNDGNGRDEVATEIIALSLTGASAWLGPVTVSLGPVGPTLGTVEEAVNNVPGVLDLPPYAPGPPADSFFDVFVDLNLGGLPMLTHQPLALNGAQSGVPAGPGDVLTGPEYVALFDHTGQPTGFAVRVDRWEPNPVVETDVFPAVTAEMRLLDPAGGAEAVAMSGHARIEVFFEGSAEGDAVDDDGNQLDDVLMSLAVMELDGTSGLLGPFHLALGAAPVALGICEEKVDTASGRLDLPPFAPGGIADSFFDVLIDVTLTSGTIHNSTPLNVRGTSTFKPAGATDIFTSVNRVPLLDEGETPTGLDIDQLELVFGPIATSAPSANRRDAHTATLRVSPNPAVHSARISFELGAAAPIETTIFDVTGRRVAVLARRMGSVGTNHLHWDGRSATGRALPSGVYLVRVRTHERAWTGRMSLLR